MFLIGYTNLNWLEQGMQKNEINRNLRQQVKFQAVLFLILNTFVRVPTSE